MDNVKPVTKWQDGAGQLFDTEEEAKASEARRVACNILRQAINFRTQVIDIDMIADRMNALVDCLHKVKRHNMGEKM